MAWTLCTSGAAIARAGANANATVVASITNMEYFSNAVEGRIAAKTRRTWVANYSSLSTDVKRALESACADMIAMHVISYDMSGYTSLAQAQTMLNFLRDSSTEVLESLKDFKSNDMRTP